MRQLIKVMNQNPAREALFKAWLEVHRGILGKIARSFARTRTDAADLRQEMMLQLWISLPAYSAQARASTWIYKVCLNTALMWRRGAGRRERRIEAGADITQLATDSATPADSAAKEDLMEQLYRSIQMMQDIDRVLVLLMLDGLSYREIAEITGISENHAGVALTRARKRLMELMKGVTDELG